MSQYELATRYSGTVAIGAALLDPGCVCVGGGAGGGGGAVSPLQGSMHDWTLRLRHIHRDQLYSKPLFSKHTTHHERVGALFVHLNSKQGMHGCE